MYLCYHHSDMDGKGAAIEVYKYLTENKHEKLYSSDFIQRGYDEAYSEQDYAGKSVYIVDLSFTKESIKKLFMICEQAAEVVWIDHHQSSLEAFDNDEIRKKLDNYNNLRYILNNNACGALLTHMYFKGIFNDIKSGNTPDVNITYNGYNTLSIETDDNDITMNIHKYLACIDKWDRWVYGDEKDPVLFNFGCGIHNTSVFAYADKDAADKTFNKNFWNPLMTGDYMVDKVIEEGLICKKYFEVSSRRALTSSGYECIILGHTALVLNSNGNSMVFGNRINDYDIVVLWNYNGKLNKYQYSLYSTKEDIDCASIASKLNPEGGGHKGAAGFSSDKLLFKKN